MLSGKKPVQAAVSFFLLLLLTNSLYNIMLDIHFHLELLVLRFWAVAQPANKKGGPVKSGGNKKSDGGGQIKVSKSVEPEDVEVKCPCVSGFCMLVVLCSCGSLWHAIGVRIWFLFLFAASRYESWRDWKQIRFSYTGWYYFSIEEHCMERKAWRFYIIILF